MTQEFVDLVRDAEALAALKLLLYTALIVFLFLITRERKP